MPADPFSEIRLTTLHATRGPNFWSRRSVIRMDLDVGAYDDTSSADVGGVTEALLGALPGLAGHQCSIGEPGGFVLRLRRGTYAPHIIEHVALELQAMIGHEVGYGRTRGGDEPGEYTIVFEHAHEHVGLRAAGLALQTVQHAFSGTLDSVDHAIAELAALSRVADTSPLHQQVLCGITGGDHRAATRDELVRRGFGTDQLIIDIAPAYLLRQGLPYSRSAAAIVLDTTPTDVSERYRDPERARQLMAVLADGVEPGGLLIAPAKEWEVQDMARDAGCRVAVFATDADLTSRDARVAMACAWVDSGQIRIECTGDATTLATLRPDVPAAAQVAAALAAFTLAGERAAVPADVRAS
ncbi:MAG TPA: hypothetical protein VMM18_16330 [Gemmatimonadaceae bacterium]|nr:hypothetical protein [Gemmatimonadaceae bacterium]